MDNNNGFNPFNGYNGFNGPNGIGYGGNIRK